MKRRIAVTGAVLAAIVSVLFLAPVVAYAYPSGAVVSCPAGGCLLLRYESVTYWAFGVGATVRDAGGYGLDVATPTNSSSPVRVGYAANGSQCFSGVLPGNTASRVVLNITSESKSWNWSGISYFVVGAYSFQVYPSQNTPDKVYLGPSLFVNVTNSQGALQSTSFIDAPPGLFGLNGWPPASGTTAILFGGDVAIEFLIPCGTSQVFWEVST